MFLRYKLHHILFWILYFVFWLSIFVNMYPFQLLLVNTILYGVFNAASFYLIIYILLPHYLNKRRYLAFFGLSTIVVVVFSAMLGAGLYWNMQDYVTQYNIRYPQTFLYGFISIFSMVCMLGGAKLFSDRLRSERERLEVELRYLKAQVNPHFLFNAINSVYFLIRKDPDKASETLIKLSDLLRFQLYDCSDEKIPVEKELDYIQNYIELEKIRKGERVKVEYSCEGDMSGFVIAPFMLIPFLENAFKYVSNYADFANVIRIKLVRTETDFTAIFMNTHENVQRSEVGGIGLANVKRRLELVYPNQHHLRIDQQRDTYTATLSLKVA